MILTYKGQAYVLRTEWDVKYFFMAIFEHEEGE